jgi:hypothetical protein
LRVSGSRSVFVVQGTHTAAHVEHTASPQWLSMRVSVSFLSVLLVIFIFASFWIALSALVRAFKRTVVGTARDGMLVTVYEWEHALLYINVRFSRLLPPGRHRNFGLGARHDIYILPKHAQAIVTAPHDVTSADKLISV